MTLEPTAYTTALTHAGHHAREAVRAGLRVCDHCGAVGPLTCRTRSGRATRDHRGRR